MDADVFTPERRSAVMRAVPAKNSRAELAVRRLLTRMGLRYRLHRADLPGSPDVVFPGRKVALFVHGCFWHGHDCPRGARVPKTNAAYWSAKIARNRARDGDVQVALAARGWTSPVVWECELKDETALERRLARLLPPRDRSASSGFDTPADQLRPNLTPRLERSRPPRIDLARNPDRKARDTAP